MLRAALALTFLSFLPILELGAQGTWAAGLGQRVRVTTDSGAWIGMLVQLDSTSLTLHGPGLSDSSAVTLARNRIRRLEISAGRRSNAGRGAAIGFGVGAAAGMVLGIGCANSDGFLQCTDGEVAELTLLSGLWGAGVGALLGLVSTSERWELFGANAANVSLAQHGLGLAVSLTF